MPSKSAQNSQKVNATCYVTTDGCDAWSGKLVEPNAERTDGPFATLRKARDVIKEMKEKEGIRDPVTVLVREGKYFLEEPLILSAEDSGTRECPITYTAYPGEKPIFRTRSKWAN